MSKDDKTRLLNLLEAFRVHMCTKDHAMEHCVRDGQCPMAYPARFTVEGNEIRTINYCMIETVKVAMSKSTMDIDHFRDQLKMVRERLHKVYIYRLSLAYGLIEEKDNDIEFYFERCKQ